MPIYEVHHGVPLSEHQQDQLADAITKIHTTLFTTPSIFVHVVYHHVTNPTYMAGKRRISNIIRANIRTGPTRTEEHYQTLCRSIHDAWVRIIGDGSSDEKKLRAIFVLGTITSGWESGFMIPQAGKDKQWVEENLSDMQDMAKTDPDIKDMLGELQEREDFRSIFDGNHDPRTKKLSLEMTDG